MRWRGSVRGWMAGMVAAGLMAPLSAHGDPVRADLEGTMVAWSEAGDALAYPGAELALATWFGRLGLVVEGSRQGYARRGSMHAYGAAVRLELGRPPTSEPGVLSVWTELGVARESWRLDGGLEAPETLERRRAHAGAGFSFVYPTGAGHIGAVVWLRGQLAGGGALSRGAAVARSAAPVAELPDARAIAFGAGFLAGF